MTNLKQINKKRALVTIYKDCIGDQCTHFLYGIVYQQQHKSRDLNRCLYSASSVNFYSRFATL